MVMVAVMVVVMVMVVVIDKYLFETLGLQRRCRVHKDYMITPYIMDNWFIF